MGISNISLIFAGDFIPPVTPENIFSEALLEVLDAKDFSIVNLESPLTQGSGRIEKNGNSFKAPPGSIQHILKGKFDAVSLSNNHIRDFGDQGVLETIENCKNNNVLTVGAGRNTDEASVPLKLNIKGKSITIFNYSEKEFNIATTSSPGANPFDLIDVFKQIRDAKAASDYVFIIYHGGLEYHHLPTPEIIKRFKYLIDIGSDCIVSHHTHRYSGLVEYNDKPIYFGLGNFLMPTKLKLTPGHLVGLLAKVEISDEGISPQLVPVKMSSGFDYIDILIDEEKKQISDHVSVLSKAIKNQADVEKYWDHHFWDDYFLLLARIKANNTTEYRLRKYLPFLIKPKLSGYRCRNMLNLIRCDAHRERLIKILESEEV